MGSCKSSETRHFVQLLRSLLKSRGAKYSETQIQELFFNVLLNIILGSQSKEQLTWETGDVEEIMFKKALQREEINSFKLLCHGPPVIYYLDPLQEKSQTEKPPTATDTKLNKILKEKKNLKL